jgi:hypothetical protein
MAAMVPIVGTQVNFGPYSFNDTWGGIFGILAVY